MSVDSVHIKIHRKRSVSSEVFHVALAVTDEGQCDVLDISNIPTGSSTGWSDTLDNLKEGEQKVGLMVAADSNGIDVFVGENSLAHHVKVYTPSQMQYVRQSQSWRQVCFGL